jgi:hypothetical protein
VHNPILALLRVDYEDAELERQDEFFTVSGGYGFPPLLDHGRYEVSNTPFNPSFCTMCPQVAQPSQNTRNKIKKRSLPYIPMDRLVQYARWNIHRLNLRRERSGLQAPSYLQASVQLKTWRHGACISM